MTSWGKRKFRDSYKFTFCAFRSEREMIDAFWNKIMSIKEMIIMSGFNASHSVLFSKPTENKKEKVDKESKEYKDKVNEELNYKYQTHHGYDIGWLTARSGYRFSPNNSQVKIDTDIDTMCTQINELPNVLFVDYQGLILRRID